MKSFVRLHHDKKVEKRLVCHSLKLTNHVQREKSIKTHDCVYDHIRKEIFVVGDEFGAHGGRSTLLQKFTLFPEQNNFVMSFTHSSDSHSHDCEKNQLE